MKKHPTNPVPRPANQRGRTQLGWLDSYHTFSFGGYHDPEHMGFASLRVINDDTVAPGGGFGEHPHRDMEILTWVLDGQLAHRDSLGHQETLGPGELQTMSAGRGIRHSEFNASKTQPVHFLQMWIVPESPGIEPRYQQRRFDAAGRANRWQTLASRTGGRSDGADDALPIHQDAALRVVELNDESSVDVTIDDGRYGWLHIATGSAVVQEQAMQAGDGLALTGPMHLTVTGSGAAQVLLFDLG